MTESVIAEMPWGETPKTYCFDSESEPEASERVMFFTVSEHATLTWNITAATDVYFFLYVYLPFAQRWSRVADDRGYLTKTRWVRPGLYAWLAVRRDNYVDAKWVSLMDTMDSLPAAREIGAHASCKARYQATFTLTPLSYQTVDLSGDLPPPQTLFSDAVPQALFELDDLYLLSLESRPQGVAGWLSELCGKKFDLVARNLEQSSELNVTLGGEQRQARVILTPGQSMVSISPVTSHQKWSLAKLSTIASDLPVTQESDVARHKSIRGTLPLHVFRVHRADTRTMVWTVSRVSTMPHSVFPLKAKRNPLLAVYGPQGELYEFEAKYQSGSLRLELGEKDPVGNYFAVIDSALVNLDATDSASITVRAYTLQQ